MSVRTAIRTPGLRPALRRLRPLAAPALLLVWSAFLFGYGIERGELWRTEGLRALVARNALHGDWLVPTLYGEPLLTKPPGMYIAVALASLPFGDVTEVSARLPSAVAAAATVLLFFAFFRRLLGGAGGLIAAAILPVSVMWLDKVPAAEIDILQVAWVTAAILGFLRAVECPDVGARSVSEGETAPSLTLRAPTWWWVAALLCVAGGFLTKWTAPAFFYATVIPLLGCRGQLRLL